jgi:tripartite-type tricarboxylate transporter receptor subunit TctC
MRVVRFAGTVLILFIFILGISGVGLAQKKFPAKPINVIIPFGPGDTDNNLRPFTDRMGQYLGQPLNFVYKPGASGAVGAGSVAIADPDGYTLVGTSQSSLVLVPLTQKGVSYTWKDFAPISALATGSIALAVQPQARWKGIKELLAEAKANPGKISYVSGSGTLGSTTLVAEAFFKEAQVKMNLIPAQGSGPAVTSLLGGHTDAGSISITPIFPHFQAGTLRALVVFGSARTPGLPNVPTVMELGYKSNLDQVYGLLAPKGTPKEVVEVIAQAAKKAAEEHKAAIENILGKTGMAIRYLEREEYGKFLNSEDDYWGKTIKGMDLKL